MLLPVRRRHLQIRSRHIRISDLQSLRRLNIDVLQHDVLHRRLRQPNDHPRPRTVHRLHILNRDL